jgi:hypothetical protein
MPRALELFSGTGSIGRALEAAGFEVVSLDINPKAHPTICADILTWDHTVFPPDHFDFVWGSPVCTHYSRARTTGGPRNLEWADSLVKKTLEVMLYFEAGGCKFFAFENPQTGMLKDREMVRGIPFCDVCYCKYGMDYRKATRIWTNLGFLGLWHPRPMCTKRSLCDKVQNGRHPRTAQSRPTSGYGPRFKQSELYVIPQELCEEIVAAVSRGLGGAPLSPQGAVGCAP